MNEVTPKIKAVSGIVALLLLLSCLPFSLTTSVNAETLDSKKYFTTALKLWSVSANNYGFAWFLSDNYVLLGGLPGHPREDVTYNRLIGVVCYSQPVQIRRVDTGEVVWSDSPPSGAFRVAKVVDGGARLEKIVDIPSADLEHCYPLPQGIVIGNGTMAHIELYDYEGNFITDTTERALANLVPGTMILGIDIDSLAVSLDGKLIVAQGVNPGHIALYSGDLDFIALVNGSVTGLVDPEVLTLTDDFVIAGDNQAPKIIVIDRDDPSNWNVLSGTGNYYSLIATKDSKYIFALTLDGVLEIWKRSNGLSYSLIETISTTLSPTKDIGMPHAPADAAFSEVSPIVALPNVIVSYYPEDETYSVMVANGTAGRMAAVSPQATYAFVGNTMFMLTKTDPQSGRPRVRFWGTLRQEHAIRDLSKPLAFTAPQKDWHAYFFGGRLEISKIITSAFPARLVEDPDILQGNLMKLYERGLLGSVLTTTKHAEVTGDRIILVGDDVRSILADPNVGGDPGDYQHYVLSYTPLKFTPPPYVETGEYSEAWVLRIPLDKPLGLYGNLTLTGEVSLMSEILGYNKEGRALEIFGIPQILLGAGATATAGLATKSIAYRMLLNGFIKQRIGGDIVRTKLALEAANLAGKATKYAVKVAKIAGVAMVVWMGVDAALVEWGGFGDVSPKSMVIIAPVVEDRMGKRYSAVALVLPAEESSKVPDYYNLISDILKSDGFEDVGLEAIYPATTRKQFMNLLKSGYEVQVDLRSLISETIAAKYGYSLSELTIKGINIYMLNYIEVKEGFWEWLFGIGGVEFTSALLVGSHGFSVSGTMFGGVISDPSQIASMLSPVLINDQEYSLTPGTKGAYVEFAIPEGSEGLTISFPKAHRGMFGEIDLTSMIVVKKDFSKLGDYGYVVDLHYDWKDTMIRLSRIELVDMEYPMVYAERTFVYAYGNFTHEITDAFELTNKTADESSPSGYRYDYVTLKNTKYIDPANGGILQPCKRYIIRYFYEQPPDAIMHVYLNGTQITSTKARHATVVIESRNAEQDVTYVIYFRLKMLKGLQELTIRETSETGTLHIAENSVGYRTYLIDPLVEEAVRIMQQNQTPVYLEITAKITSAPENYIKTNDEATVVYYPPPPIVEEHGKNATLQVHVYDAINGSAIEGATVRVYNDTVSYEAVTNSTGWADFTVPAQLWTILVTAENYHDYTTELYVYTNMTFNVPLVPVNTTIGGENATVSIPPGIVPPLNETTAPPITVTINGQNYSYWWLSVQVIYKDGAPFHGALVTVKNATDGSIMFQKETNGTGYVFFLVPNATHLIVQVNATNPENPSQTFFEERDFTILHHTWLVFRLNWTSKYYAPEVMLTSLEVVIHRGQGYLYGNVSHLIMVGLWTNTPQNVTVLIELLDANTSEVLNSEMVEIPLLEGFTSKMTWIPVNASKGLYVKAHAKIIAYENDTDLTNNELYSTAKFLKPFLDIQVFVFYKAIRLKVPTAVLPEDIIEIDIGAKINIPLTKPMVLKYRINYMNLKNMTFDLLQGKDENITTVAAGIVWRNFTIAVPWTSRFVINVTAVHEWEDYGENNNATITLWIDPDVKVELLTPALPMLTEGQVVKLKVNVTSNVEPGNGSGVLSVLDNSTERLLYRRDITLEPSRIYEVEFKAPENPTTFWVIRQPTADHIIWVRFAGWDMYLDNNYDSAKLTVISWQFIWVILGIIILIIVIAVIVRVIAHTAYDVIQERRKFVKKKSSPVRFSTPLAYVHKTEIADQDMQFVKKRR